MPRMIETGDEQRAKARADNQREFERWMTAVDNVIAVKLYGLSSSDLPDQTWRDWFDEGLTAAEAAQECLENEGYEDE
jgi:hypothetical protein